MQAVKSGSNNTSSTTQADATVRSKVFMDLQTGNYPNVLFYISRSCDFELILYNCIRTGDRLHKSIANVDTYDYSDKKDTGPVTPILVDNFFGFTSKPHPEPDEGKNTYSTSIKALPEHKLFIKLSKSKTHVYGRVGQSPKAIIINVHIDMTMPTVGVPRINKFVLTGIDKKTKQFAQETIPVTDSMRNSVDVAAIFREYMLGQRRDENEAP